MRTADQSLAAQWWGTCAESNFGSPGLIAQQLVRDHGTGLYESGHIFSDAVEEVVSARIWGGMHFCYSGEVGASLGEKSAHWVSQRYLLPLDEPRLP